MAFHLLIGAHGNSFVFCNTWAGRKKSWVDIDGTYHPPWWLLMGMSNNHNGHTNQWEFQDPKMEVPTIYFRPIF